MPKSSTVVVAVSVLLVAMSLVALSSSAQDPSRTTNKTQPETRQVSPQQPAAAQAQPDFSKNTWELPADADKTKNPTALSPESIAKGKELYLDRAKGNCAFCHGEDGAGNEESLPRLRRKPADISNKERMSAMTDGEVFWKISKGITGIMPAGEKRLSEEERWNIVNYVRTLAKEKASN